MPHYKLYICLCLSLLAYTMGSAQSCPPNLNFEQGNLNNWYMYTGSCCPINAPVLTGPLPNRHVLTSGLGTDYYGGFPVVDLANGIYSLKLGNDSVGSQAERARYYLKIPKTSGTFMVIYRYAVVFQEPNHLPAEQPRFEVSASDSVLNTPISCSEISYVASPSLPGFMLSPIAPLGIPVYYKTWSTASLRIDQAYAGKTIAIDFKTGDCQQGAHFGYAYVDMNCSYFQLENEISCGQPSITLKGPPGYQSYKWMNSNFTVTYGTTQDVVVPGPTQKTTYAVILTPYSGFGCPDTFYTRYYISNPKVKAQNDTTMCYGDKIQLQSTLLAPVQSHQWSPATGLTCTNCATPLASPFGTTVYYHAVKDATGCTTEDSVQLTVDTLVTITSPDTLICAGDTLQLNVSSTNSFTPVSYAWTPPAGLSCTNCNNPKALIIADATYTVKATNSLGCTYDKNIHIKVDGTTTGAIEHIKDTICVDEPITLNKAGSTPAIQYAWYTDTGTVVSGQGTKNLTVFWNRAGVKKVRLIVSNITCSTTDTTEIVVWAPPIASFDVLPDWCMGSAVKIYPREQNASYLWTADGIDISDSVYRSPVEMTFNSLGTKVIHVGVTDRFGCHSEFTDTITIHPLPTASIDSIDRVSICNGVPALVQAQWGQYYVYQWEPAIYFRSNNSANVTANITHSTHIRLTVSDQWGCSDVDSEYVNTELCCEIKLPDAFTPNGDGLNDQFRVMHYGEKKVRAFLILNRWGKVLFETNDMRKGWDGNYLGTPQNGGTYFYYLKYECDDKPFEKKESFILIR